MSHPSDTYSKRVLQQRRVRNEQKLKYQQMIYRNNDDTDSTDYGIDDIQSPLSDDELASIMNQFQSKNHWVESYLANTNDTGQVDGESPFQLHDDAVFPLNDDVTFQSDDEAAFQLDDTPPLYNKSTIKTGQAVQRLMNFFIKSNFDKQKIIAIMRLIKSLLPNPNKLPTTFRQILKIFGKTPSFTTKFYCNSCLVLTIKRNSYNYSTNLTCTSSNLQLSKRQLTEIVIMNIREKLQSIVRRNFSLLSGSEKLFPAFDIARGSRYQSKIKRIIHPITLNIHADGAALVRSTKSALWPCFCSIVELPPPVREYQCNIMTVGLWVSCIKPDVNIFLEDIIDQLTALSANGTTIFVKGHEFKIYVKTQMFISDLPAKSLFMKTINFNGYYACTTCITEGNYSIYFPFRACNNQKLCFSLAFSRDL